MLGEVFDPQRDVLKQEGQRPHWAQDGTIVFITFGTLDAIPRRIAEVWESEKANWLHQRGFGRAHWSRIVPTLPAEVRNLFQREFRRKQEVELDRCQGRCLLRRPDLAQIVADALLHFDGQRYQMGDFVVMPNHVHLLASFSDASAMREQCDSWRHFTATQIHRAIGERGRFWRSEPFDHLVRTAEQYDHLRRYVAKNPTQAGLGPGEYLYRRGEG